MNLKIPSLILLNILFFLLQGSGQFVLAKDLEEMSEEATLGINGSAPPPDQLSVSQDESARIPAATGNGANHQNVNNAPPIQIQPSRSKDETELRVQSRLFVPDRKTSRERKTLNVESAADE